MTKIPAILVMSVIKEIFAINSGGSNCEALDATPDASSSAGNSTILQREEIVLYTF